MTEALKVLIIEDDPDVALGCEQALLLEGIATECAGSAEQARKKLGRDFHGIVVSDIRLPKMDGMAFLRETLAVDPELPVVLITGHGDVTMAVQAMKDGAYDFIQKPFPPEYLVEVVRRALEKRRLVLAVRELRRQLEQRDLLESRLIGRAPGMQQLRDRLTGLAGSAADVLIYGETGTGKELVARCLHDLSARRHGNFVAINCGGMAETLLDSELFGHEPGAFTGAQKRRIGKIEHASGGTLFLDEIESMPMTMQIKLLRVLQERTLERLGSNTQVSIDCRVIAATKEDLLDLAARGGFRNDLYYRLLVFPIDVPPLRERPDDIEPLALHFLGRLGRREHALPAVTLRRLRVHTWPGNVRELRNVIERAHILASGEILRDDHVVLDAAPTARQSVGADLNLDENARGLIRTAIARAGGNKALAARMLGITRRTLYSRIKLLGLEAEDAS